MPFSRDTSPETVNILVGLLHQASLGRRLAMVDEHFATGRIMTWSALKWRYPASTDVELEMHYACGILGPELGRRVAAARRSQIESKHG